MNLKQKFQPAGDLFSQNELTLLREEKEQLEVELMVMVTPTEVTGDKVHHIILNPSLPYLH